VESREIPPRKRRNKICEQLPRGEARAVRQAENGRGDPRKGQRKGHIEWNGDLVEPQIPAAGCAGRSPNFDNGPREYPRRAEWNKKPTDSPVAGITPVEEGHDCQRKHHRCNALCARDLPPKARNRAFSFCSGHGYLPTGGAACVIVRFERHDSSRWLLAGEALEVGHLLFHFFAGGVGGGADALDA
jgi:hypothetical protein